MTRLNKTPNDALQLTAYVAGGPPAATEFRLYAEVSLSQPLENER